jgi:hypothetical protein
MSARPPEAALARALDQATYQGYVAGFRAAQAAAHAAALARGQAVLAADIAALAPLPDRPRGAPGQA